MKMFIRFVSFFFLVCSFSAYAQTYSGYNLDFESESEEGYPYYQRRYLTIKKGDCRVGRELLYEGLDEFVRLEIAPETYKISDNEHAIAVRVSDVDYRSGSHEHNTTHLMLFRVNPQGVMKIFDEHESIDHCIFRHNEEGLQICYEETYELILSVLPSVSLGFRDLSLEGKVTTLTEPYYFHPEPNETGKVEETPIYEHSLKKEIFFWNGSQYVSNL